MKRLFFAALLVACAGLSACGGSSGPELVIATATPTSTPTATPSATATTSATPTATPKPALGEGLLPGFVTTD
jgi:hypothetical protein